MSELRRRRDVTSSKPIAEPAEPEGEWDEPEETFDWDPEGPLLEYDSDEEVPAARKLGNGEGASGSNADGDEGGVEEDEDAVAARVAAAVSKRLGRAAGPPAEPEPNILLPGLGAFLFTALLAGAGPLYVPELNSRMLSLAGLLLLLLSSTAFIFLPVRVNLESRTMAPLVAALVTGSVGLVLGGIVGSTLGLIDWSRRAPA
jgi:hypothetical protein